MKHMKGFFFVVIMFLLLSFILASLSLFVRSTQLAEERYATQFQQTNLDLVLNQLEDSQMDKLVKTIMYQSFFSLNAYAAQSPDHRLVPGEYLDVDSPEVKRAKLTAPVGEAVKQLFLEGNADGSLFSDGVALDTTNQNNFAVSMNQWAQRFDRSLNQMGLKLSSFSLEKENVEITQINPNTFVYTVRDIEITISDSTGRINLHRSYTVSGEIYIDGFTDPAIKNAGRELDLTLSRPIYFKGQTEGVPAAFEGAYNEPSDLNPRPITRGIAGQGWFYGSLAFAGPVDDPRRPDDVPIAADILPQDRDKYVLVGTYREIVSFDTTPDIPDSEYEDFGAYIVLNRPLKPRSQEQGCVSQTEAETFNALQYGADCSPSYDRDTETVRPFMVAPDFILSSATECPVGRCVLIVNGYSFQRLDSNERRSWKIPSNQPDPEIAPTIYDVEVLRDYILCGYSIKSEDGPSYQQRLLVDSYALVAGDEDLLDPEFGYSTIVFGQSLIPPGADAGEFNDLDVRSKVDYEFFSGVENTQRVRGLPGCRDPLGCGLEYPQNPVGHMTFSTGGDGTMVQYIGVDAPLSCGLLPGAPCRGED